MVNPVGVQRDIHLFHDSQEDVTWNAVWEVKTTIDSLGWVAGFRIPLNQLRFGIGTSTPLGSVSTARSRASTSGRAGRCGAARSSGSRRSSVRSSASAGIGDNQRLEVMPYMVQSNQTRLRASEYGRAQQGSLGADLKVGLSSNLTLDATINPDFGQVEADPPVLNLSAFARFCGEQRPFFLEGNRHFIV